MTRNQPERGRYRIAVLMLTQTCNMVCPYCISTEKRGHLSFEGALAKLDELQGMGIESVVLGGGEPLVWREDPFRLARAAKERGFLVQLATNGIRLPEGFEDRDEIDRYVLPLDSADPAIHDGLRPTAERSHHALILSRLAALQAKGKRTTISTVITQRNHDGTGALGQLLARLESARPFLHSWHLYRFLPEGRGGEANAEPLRVDDEQFDRACREAKATGLPIPVYRRPDMIRARTVTYR